MARYIDADKFIERLKASPAFLNMGMDGYFLLDVVENLLKNFPTADVAPKSEVAREIIDIIEQRRSLKEDASKGHYVDFWKGVYQGADWAYRDIKEIIEQKYTEGKTNEDISD